MKSFLIGSMFLATFGLQALDYELQFENDEVCVARAKIMPSEEIEFHRDVYPQVVVALKGGIITRLEADGSTTEVYFPTGVPVVRPMDPPDELHKSLNNGSEPIELMIVQFKTENNVVSNSGNA